MMKRLWNDEAGVIISMELVLVSTILVIGMIVGLKSVRDAVVTELADVAQAIANMDQSYTYSGVRGHAGATDGSRFVDSPDFCDGGPSMNSHNSKCVNVCAKVNNGEGIRRP